MHIQLGQVEIIYGNFGLYPSGILDYMYTSRKQCGGGTYFNPKGLCGTTIFICLLHNGVTMETIPAISSILRKR
jgi:hypothetical protein